MPANPLRPALGAASRDTWTVSLAQLRDLWDEADLAGSGASDEEIRRAEEELGRRLPDDYLEFMRWRNGGEGAVGEEGYAHLCAVGELAEFNAAYAELDHLSGFLLFGSDRGGEAFAFTDEGDVVVVPFIGGAEDAVPQGSFAEFLLRCASGRTLERG